MCVCVSVCNEAGEQTSRVLAQALPGPDCKLRALDISWNSLRGHGAASVARSLVTNASLTSLNAAWNGFGGLESAPEPESNPVDPAVMATFVDANTTRVEQTASGGASLSMQAISEWLTQSRALRSLDLSHNRISAEGSIVLAAGLEACACVDVLKLDGNPIYAGGARSVWLASALSSDAFNLRRLLSLSECGLSSGQTAWSPAEPAGKYCLDMRLSYAHTICRTIMRIAANNDAILVEASISGKPFKLHQLSTTQAEDSWELPAHGVLMCKLLWLQEAHLHHLAPAPTPMSEISSDTILDVLIGDLRPVDQDVFLKTAFTNRNVSKEQVLGLLRRIPPTHAASRVNLLCNVFHKMTSQVEQDEVLDSLSPEDLDTVHKRLGTTILFTRFNPTGAYRLNLADPDEREVALILCQVKNVELQRLRAASANPAALKSPAIELVWRNAKLKGSSHLYDPAQTLPPSGFLDIDLVSPVLPTHGAKALDDQSFEKLLEEMNGSSNAQAARRRASRTNGAAADNYLPRDDEAETWSERRRKL